MRLCKMVIAIVIKAGWEKLAGQKKESLPPRQRFLIARETKGESLGHRAALHHLLAGRQLIRQTLYYHNSGGH